MRADAVIGRKGEWQGGEDTGGRGQVSTESSSGSESTLHDGCDLRGLEGGTASPVPRLERAMPRLGVPFSSPLQTQAALGFLCPPLPITGRLRRGVGSKMGHVAPEAASPVSPPTRGARTHSEGPWGGTVCSPAGISKKRGNRSSEASPDTLAKVPYFRFRLPAQ